MLLTNYREIACFYDPKKVCFMKISKCILTRFNMWFKLFNVYHDSCRHILCDISFKQLFSTEIFSYNGDCYVHFVLINTILNCMVTFSQGLHISCHSIIILCPKFDRYPDINWCFRFIPMP